MLKVFSCFGSESVVKCHHMFLGWLSRNRDSRITFPATPRSFLLTSFLPLQFKNVQERSSWTSRTNKSGTELSVSAYEIKQTFGFDAESPGGGCSWCFGIVVVLFVAELCNLYFRSSSAGVCATLFRISCRVYQCLLLCVSRSSSAFAYVLGLYHWETNPVSCSTFIANPHM